jgi:predicted nucleic acid-binding protein
MNVEDALVPALWWFEVRNVLIVGERRRRITEADTATFLETLAGMAIVTDHSVGEARILRLARHHGLTVYDAAYLELASRRSSPLATLDTDLAAAAKAQAVALL